jgi:translocation and assembly module TamA
MMALSGSAMAGVDVRIHGLGPTERDNAYAKSGLLAYAKATDAAKGEYSTAEVQRLFKEGDNDIRAALQPFGWYRPVIHSELHGSKPDWTAIYDVEAGPPTTIAHIDIQITGEGAGSKVLQQTRSKLPMHTGERLNQPAYEDAKAALLRAAYAQGYLDAAFTRHELRVDINASTAAILLTLDTGPRYYFGDVTIQQDAGLNEKFLRRYLTFKPGQPFDADKLLSTQFAFTDLDYFKYIQVEPQRSKAGPDHRVPVVISATAKAVRAWRFGAGYGTDTGVRGLAGVEFRRVNQYGHKLGITLRPSQNISSAIADYRIPIGHNAGDNLSFTAEGLSENVADINEHVYTLGTSLSRRLGTWSPRYYLKYTRDSYAFTGEPRNVSRLLIPGASFRHSDLDDPIYPRLGYSLFFDVHGAHDAVLSDATFVQFDVALHWVVPLAPKARVLWRAEEGASFVSKFSELPSSQRFFAGGDESVRGYGYKSLGPKDAKGRVIGGKYLTTGSVEVDYDLWKPWGVATFFDVGGADDTPQVRLHEGVGVGVRYLAPFGSIALDLAHPLDRDAGLVHVHLGIRVGL